MSTRRELIMASVSDLVTDFVYYDRREDEELTLGDIEEALDEEEISIEEIVHKFELRLREELES